MTMISRAGTVSLSNTSALPNTPPNPSTLSDHFPLNVVDALYEGVDSGEWTVSTFEDTPPMSTYLLAFANGAFKHRESSYTSPISGKTRPLRVYGIQFLADRFVTLVPDIDVQRRRISSGTLNSCSMLPLAPFLSSRKCSMWSTPCPSSTHLSRMTLISAQWRTGYALLRVHYPECC